MNHATRLQGLGFAKVVAILSFLSGCAVRPEPRFIKASDLKDLAPLEQGRALVIEFEQGDTIPLAFTLDGPFVKSPDDTTIGLRVARHFFLRIDEGGLRASADGKSFDDKPSVPGKFQFGFGAGKEGPRATIAITTPSFPMGAPPP